MTLTRFVTKSAFRNKRRSVLTVLSISFSLLLLTLMITIWNAFYIDKGSAESAQRLITRHRVSLTQSMPAFYREKIRAIPGVVAVTPNNWFGGIYNAANYIDANIVDDAILMRIQVFYGGVQLSAACRKRDRRLLFCRPGQ